MMGAMGGGCAPGFDRLPSKKTAARSAPLAYRIRITLCVARRTKNGARRQGVSSPE